MLRARHVSCILTATRVSTGSKTTSPRVVKTSLSALLLLKRRLFPPQLETLRMNSYFRSTADHILAQLFFKKQAEFKFLKAAKK